MEDLFEPAVEYTLANEGGYTNNPNDSGGPTNYGITQADYTAYLGRPATAQDVMNMPVSAAKEIYKKHYWTPGLTQEPVATCLFDCSVLYGKGRANKLAQQAANTCGSDLDVDGDLGSASIAALNSVHPGAFVDAYHDEIVARINGIISSNPSQETFRRGWMNRANRLLTLV